MDNKFGIEAVERIEQSQEKLLEYIQQANQTIDDFDPVSSKTLNRFVTYGKKVVKLRSNLDDIFIRLQNIQNRLQVIASDIKENPEDNDGGVDS